MSQENEIENKTTRIDRDAADWLVRQSRGLSAEEQLEYDGCRAQNERHQEWIDMHIETRAGLERLSALLPAMEHEPNPDYFAPLTAQNSNPKRYSLGTVAAVAATIATGFVLHLISSSNDITFNDRYTDSFKVSEFERRFLADGTLVELKTGTQMEIQYSSIRREVRLLEGEAHFNVVEDSLRPFLVHAGDTVFRAIGTSFNIRLSSDTVELLVTEGVVRVDWNETGAPAMEKSNPIFRPPEVIENQRAIISLDSENSISQIETVSKKAVEAKLIWKHEMLEFEATPLSEAVLEFNRRNRDQIEIADSSLGRELIDGSFRSDNVDGFVALLEISANIKVERSKKRSIVIRKITL
ncbi:MAG: FecR domain-containing protein [Opitutaceae bacterium]|nr:FecR domain-containing protein [Opitutaceae bacterium]